MLIRSLLAAATCVLLLSQSVLASESPIDERQKKRLRSTIMNPNITLQKRVDALKVLHADELVDDKISRSFCVWDVMGRSGPVYATVEDQRFRAYHYGLDLTLKAYQDESALVKDLRSGACGSVIHAMHHEQDMRNMGGLRNKIPFTYWMMIIGTLALTGVGIPGTMFGFAGFFSKDAIIEAAYAFGGNVGSLAFWLLVFAALMTSFYSWRLIHLTFHGSPRDPSHGETAHPDPAHAALESHDEPVHHQHGSAYDNAHESPPVMLIPLFVLAIGAVLSGAIFYDVFFGHAEHVEHFFQGSLVVDAAIIDAAHNVPTWVKWSATFAMLIGFALAWYMYIRNPDAPKELAREHRGLYQFLLNKWYFDELYDRIFVRPTRWLGTALWKGFDDWLVDETIVEGLGRRVKDVTAQVVRLQSGYLYHYAFAMIIGIAALITWAIAAGGLLG